MADGQRDQMLVDFQECTQIEDIETCIDILEQNGWNLMNAIQSVMPHADGDPEPPPSYNSASQGSESGVSTEPVDMDFVNTETFSHYDPCSASGPHFEPTPTTSFASRGFDHPRLLSFTIEYRGKNVSVNVYDTEKVVKIKECIYEELRIPIDKQDLRGWPSKRVDDKKTLRELQLPKENTLYLLTPDLNLPSTSLAKQSSSTETVDIGQNLSKEYTLNIMCHDTNKECKLKFIGSKTVGEVKSAIYHMTNIPVRHQVWSGWPEPTGKDDNLTLGACGLQYPEHDLTITKANIPTNKSKPTQEDQIEISDDDDDSYHLEEDIFEADDTANNRRQTPLMPVSVIDTTDALEHFTREFRDRYGESHPVFYVGSLDCALREALMGKAKDRKLLAVYLHHDSSILSNVFCSQILCQESVVSYLCNNFITWAWDMTHDTNNARFISMATRHFGSVVAGQVRFTKPDQLPVLLIISRARATNEVVDMIPGSVTLDELMMRLMQVSETFHAQQLADIKDEEEREARENIRQEQEIAFQQSLAADRAKAEAQRLEHEKEIQQQMEEERLKREEEDRKQALQVSAAMHIQEEPPEDCTEQVSRIRIRTPKGETIQRRFYASEKLKYLIYYVTSQGFHIDEYKILTTFPRRDVSQLDEEKSLAELKIYPQETLILEERQ